MSENTNTTKRRSAIQIMGSLIGLVKPLLHIMLAAIILGTLGYLCAIFLTILEGQVIKHGLFEFFGLDRILGGSGRQHRQGAARASSAAASGLTSDS